MRGVAGWCLVLLVACGCGSAGPKLYDVSGTVTWEGQPLKDGDIQFTPADESLVPASAKIVDGKYALQAPAGAHKVEVRAVRAGKFDPVMNAATPVQYIPARYNDQTTLTADVKADGPNQINFPLTAR